LKPERIASVRQLAERLPVNHRDPGKVLVRLTRELEHLVQVFFVPGVQRERDVDVGRAERVLPVLRRARARVVQHRGARRHVLPELDREAVERLLRHAERLESLEREGDAEPAGQRRHPPVVRGSDVRKDPQQHLATVGGVVDAQHDVLAAVGLGTRAQDDRLDVAGFDRGASGSPQESAPR
jgi:hypothetical protein